MKKPVVPCFDCKDRTSECHSACEKYISYVKEHKLFAEKVKEAQGSRNFWNDNIAKRTWKNMRRKDWKIK